MGACHQLYLKRGDKECHRPDIAQVPIPRDPPVHPGLPQGLRVRPDHHTHQAPAPLTPAQAADRLPSGAQAGILPPAGRALRYPRITNQLDRPTDLRLRQRLPDVRE